MKTEISDTVLEAQIPSCPGSPRSLGVGSIQSLVSKENIKEAAVFLQKESEFLDAAEIGDDNILAQMISQGANINETNQIGQNALHLAVVCGNMRCIKLLLDANINPNVKDNLGMTPLSLCLLRRASLPIVEILFKYGAILFPRRNLMDTGLFLQFLMMSTPTHEEILIMKVMMQHGGKINDPAAPGGRQALHFAAMSDNCPLIKALHTLGADIEALNDKGETALDVAKRFKCQNALECLLRLEYEALKSQKSYEEVNENVKV